MTQRKTTLQLPLCHRYKAKKLSTDIRLTPSPIGFIKFFSVMSYKRYVFSSNFHFITATAFAFAYNSNFSAFSIT